MTDFASIAMLGFDNFKAIVKLTGFVCSGTVWRFLLAEAGYKQGYLCGAIFVTL